MQQHRHVRLISPLQYSLARKEKEIERTKISSVLCLHL